MKLSVCTMVVRFLTGEFVQCWLHCVNVWWKCVVPKDSHTIRWETRSFFSWKEPKTIHHIIQTHRRYLSVIAFRPTWSTPSFYQISSQKVRMRHDVRSTILSLQQKWMRSTLSGWGSGMGVLLSQDSCVAYLGGTRLFCDSCFETIKIVSRCNLCFLSRSRSLFLYRQDPSLRE